MTNEACAAYCESQGFAYAGTQWYTECCMPTRIPFDLDLVEPGLLSS